MPSSQYFVRNSEGVYFLTMTVVDWVDVFTRPAYRHIIVDSLRYCQQQKGLHLFGWCLMSNHLHLLAMAADGINLSDILRDMKKHTSKQIIKAIQEEPVPALHFQGLALARIPTLRAIRCLIFWQEIKRCVM